MSKSSRQTREFIADLTRIGVNALTAHLQLPADQGLRVMQAITDQACIEYAGRNMYVPVGYDPRNREIAAKFRQSSRAARACTPERVKELSLEYAMTTRQIYGILREVRMADFKARQGTLPGLENDPA